MELEKVLEEKIDSIVKIDEGFSVDDKFLVNDKFLVRIISEDRFERFKNVFDFQKKFYDVALCQRPIKFEILNGIGYYVTEFLPGKNGLEVINSFSTEKQRKLGIIAGYELSKVHKVYIEEDFDVKGYLDNYFESKVKVALESEVQKDIPEILDIIEVVRNNLHHLYKLKGILAHADYHLFNMIFDKDEYKGVIDFERCRTGIFLTDFRNNTPHNSDVSPEFASGFIDGYLDEIYIEDFFLMYNIHDLLVTIAALPWVKIYNPENIEIDIQKIKKIFKDCEDLELPPSWYVGKY